jgi:hypothetical protein
LAENKTKPTRASVRTGERGKSCLYVRRLADLDVGVLERLVVGSVAEVRRRYG